MKFPRGPRRFDWARPTLSKERFLQSWLGDEELSGSIVEHCLLFSFLYTHEGDLVPGSLRLE